MAFSPLDVWFIAPYDLTSRYEAYRLSQGRTFTTRESILTVHPTDGSNFKPRHFFGLLLLMVVPTFALYRGSTLTVLKLVAGYWMLISGFTYWIYAWDKRSARSNGRREPERRLHLFELLGGWPGAFVAQHRLRHKNAKLSYQISFWLIVAMYQLVATDCLLGWPAWRELSRVMKLS